MERATGTLKDDAMAAMMLNRSAVACCGAAPQLERGGQTTMLIGGGYAHPSLEEARLEAGNGCPRYFAQCEQGVAQCIHSAASYGGEVSVERGALSDTGRLMQEHRATHPRAEVAMILVVVQSSTVAIVRPIRPSNTVPIERG